MNKEEVSKFIESKDIWHEFTEHGELASLDDIYAAELPYPEANGKNLFVRDNKKRNYYMITVRGFKEVDLQKVREDQGTKRLGFASDDDLMSMLELKPGSVTPLGLLNDSENKVVWFIDNDFFEVGKIGVHPNDNSATVWLKPEDLVALVEESGTTVERIDI